MVKNKWGLELKPHTICAIDASTNSLAFALFEGEDLKTVGKINFQGNDIYEKVMDAGKKVKGEWVFSIYNVYSRKNAASISFRQNQESGKNEAVDLSIFGIVPSVTYNFKF